MLTKAVGINTMAPEVKGWHPSKGDYVKHNASEESKFIQKRLRKKILLEVLFSIIFIALLITSFIIF